MLLVLYAVFLTAFVIETIALAAALALRLL